MVLRARFLLVGADMTQPQKRSAGEITGWLVAEIARLTGAPPEKIGVDVEITDYLFDSRDALSLAADLQTWLGIEMAASIVWDHPTIAALAEHVAETMAGGDASASEAPR